MYLLHIALFITGLCLTHVSARVRHWLPDVTYSNPDNWNLGRVPCETDRVVFPEVINVPVELSPKTGGREMVLPSSGSVFMSYSGSFSLKEVSSRCKGQDVEFKKFDPMYWLDAKNWDGWNLATPHTDRVPCSIDKVVFPNNGTFKVIMPWETLHVAGLKFNGEEMNTITWQDFSSSEVGYQQFSKTDNNPGKVEIISAPATCDDVGCMCSNEYLEESICERVWPCGTTNCFSPVRPKGFCCQICGAVLTYQLTSTFKIAAMRQVIEGAVKDHGWAITWYASVYETDVQVVLVQRDEYSGDVDEISAKLNDILVTSHLTLQKGYVHSSGPVYYKTSVGQYLLRFFLTMLAAMILMAGIFIYHYNATVIAARNKVASKRRPFLFARFENQSGTMSQSRLSVVSLPQAFDNPMYEDFATSQTARGIIVENPTYSGLTKEEEEAAEVAETEMIDSRPNEKEELSVDSQL